jgi:glycosyltransferase involved in cell wall biosynthesis
MPNPKVTVLMPVYNGEKYLREAIDSILNQTFTDFEFLIVDDGSIDNSVEIINSYQDSRINLVKNDKNEGLVYTLNRGLSLAKGEYIARMDCDDISLPERLKKQVDYLDINSEISVVGTWITIIDLKREVQINWQPPVNPLWIKWSLYFYSPLAHPSVMFRKDIIRSIGSYFSCSAEDYELWCRTSQQYLLANIPIALLIYRQHKNSMTQIHKLENINDASRINQKIIQELLEEDINHDYSFNLFHQINQVCSISIGSSILTYQIYQKFYRKYNLKIPEIRYLKQDTANIIYKCVRPHIRHVESWRFIILAFFLYPSLVITFIKSLSFTKRLFRNEFF